MYKLCMYIDMAIYLLKLTIADNGKIVSSPVEIVTGRVWKYGPKSGWPDWAKFAHWRDSLLW
jgi:hypothetical protein